MSEWQQEVAAVKRHLINIEQPSAKAAIIAILERALRRASPGYAVVLETSQAAYEAREAEWRAKCEEQAREIATLRGEIEQLKRGAVARVVRGQSGSKPSL